MSKLRALTHYETAALDALRNGPPIPISTMSTDSIERLTKEPGVELVWVTISKGVRIRAIARTAISGGGHG